MKVGITTTDDRFAAWARAFGAAGFEPVAVPCIEIVDLGCAATARRAAERADAVVITSARTVEIVWPSGGMDGIDVVSVGASTSAAASAAGARIIHQGSGGSSALVEGLDGTLAGLEGAYLCAAGSDPSTRSALEAIFGSLTAVAVYDSVPVAPAPKAVDAAVFGSPSAVEGWELSRQIPDLTGAIGSTTETALRERDAEIVITPDRPGVHTLARALRRHLEATT